MSRKSEMAQSLLHRYYSSQGPTLERPKSVRSVDSLSEAQRFRSLCVNDISMRVSRIHDPLLSDYQIRDLNDELNKLMKEKAAWEYRILDLGGPDFISYSKRHQGGTYEKDSTGYKYFGRAKDLPDVKSLLEAKQNEIKKANQAKTNAKNDAELIQRIAEAEKKIDPVYYGIYEETRVSGGLVSQVPTSDEVVDEARQILEDETLFEDFLSSQDLQEMNGRYFQNSEDDTLVAYERAKTRELLREYRTKHSKPGPNKLVHFDESIQIPNDAVEKKLVQLKIASIQQRL
ncbi:unnamed protein product [Kuraishia capsulata CBS 1993]|uniref:Pre-mRNA-splicing factor ISY1 n=1 Tax=Kuraishia capsulata CBS 1993 TaxID=1382522 RepID=W6MHE0_9ASCO|nr:uncharacterized protein KUCA_T00001045001 [Kuraishia capsulata CBS 1993]CDK25078.1 unnamed protein product [Kuraishia capsulata CBS 1993]